MHLVVPEGLDPVRSAWVMPVDANKKVATNLQRIIAACESDANETELADAR